MKDNIILIGFMGSGKTSVGTLLADQLSYNFIDTDVSIEEEQHTKISLIFNEQGEEYFRDLETKFLEDMLQGCIGTIISTGGGLPLRECNRKLLSDLGVVVYLKATKATIVKRVSGDTNRPILAGDNIEERVEKLLKERAPYYEDVAQIKINTDDKSYSEIILEILNQYNFLKKENV